MRDNILVGRPDAEESEVMEAARQANALAFIQDLPEGFDTILSGAETPIGWSTPAHCLARAF